MSDKQFTKKEDVAALTIDGIATELKSKLSTRKTFDQKIEGKKEELNSIREEAAADIQPTLRALVLKLGLFETLPEGAIITVSFHTEDAAPVAAEIPEAPKEEKEEEAPAPVDPVVPVKPGKQK